MRRPISILVLGSALALPAGAFAQDASSQAAAQALFEQARQLMTQGKYAEACPKLAESQRLDPGAGTLLNLGHCYEKNGQTASAWVTFKDAAAAADLKHRDDWSARARERSAALVPSLSRLVIDVEARTDGLQVRRDGVNVGPAEWGVPIPVDPGEHTIEALAPGKKKWSVKVNVGAKSDQQRVNVPALEVEPVESATPAATEPAPQETARAQMATAPSADSSSDGKTQRTLGIVGMGVGGAGLALGSIFGIIALGKNSDSKSLCPTTTCTNPAGAQANDDAKSAATISTVGFAAGAALAVGGAVLFFTAPKRREAAFRLAPAVGSSSAGVTFGGAW